MSSKLRIVVDATPEQADVIRAEVESTFRTAIEKQGLRPRVDEPNAPGGFGLTFDVVTS